MLAILVKCNRHIYISLMDFEIGLKLEFIFKPYANIKLL